MWANLNSFASNLAERGATLLAELDERIDDSNEEDFGDEGETRKDPKLKRSTSIDIKTGDFLEDPEFEDDIDAVLPRRTTDGGPAPAARKSSPDVTSNKASRINDVKELQAQLVEVKAMRQELRAEVSGQMQQFSQEVHGAISAIALGGGTGSKVKLKTKVAEDQAVDLDPGSGHGPLLDRALEAERCLNAARETIETLQAASRAYETEIASARDAHAQVSSIKAQLRAALGEKEQAELALGSLTKMQSLERTELTQQMQDLQSKLSSERQYGMTQASEAKAMHRALEALREEMNQVAAARDAALEAAKNASSRVGESNSSDEDDLKQRLEVQTVRCSLQQQVLEETQAQLDSYIRSSAESARKQEQLQVELNEDRARLAAELNEKDNLLAQLNSAAGVERQLQEKLLEAYTGQEALETVRKQAAAEIQALQNELQDSRQLCADAAAALATQKDNMREQERTMSFEFQEVQKKVRELSGRLAAAETSEAAARQSLHQAELQASARHSKDRETAEENRSDLERQLEVLQAQFTEQARAAAEAAAAARKEEAEQAQMALQVSHSRFSEVTLLLEQTRQAADESLVQHRAEIAAKESEISVLEKRMHEYLTSSEGTDSKVEQELAAAELRLSSAHEEASRQRARADAAEADCVAKIRDAEVAMAAKVAALEEAQTLLRTQRADAEAKAAELIVSRSEVEAAQMAVQHANDNFKKAMSKASDLKKALAENQESLAASHQARQQAEANLSALHRETIEALEIKHTAELDVLRNEQNSRVNDLLVEQNLKAETQEAAIAQLKGASETLDAVKKELADCLQERDAAKFQSEEAKRNASALQSALAEATARLEQRGADTEQELAALQSQLEQTLSDLRAAQAAAVIASASHEKSIAEQQIAFDAALSEAQAHAADHSHALFSLKQELIENQNRLGQALSDLNATNAMMAARNSDSSEELRLKQDALAEALLLLQDAQSVESRVLADLASVRAEQEILVSEVAEARKRADLAEATALTLQEQFQADVHSQQCALRTQAEAATAQRADLEAQLTQALSERELYQQKLTLQQHQWENQLESMELAAQDRTIENAALREQLRQADAAATHQSEQLQAHEKALASARDELMQEQEKMNAALIEAQHFAKQLSQDLADSHSRADAASKEVSQLRVKVQALDSVRAQLEQAQQAVAATEILRSRADEAEAQLSRLEQKKGRDLEALRAQNTRISSLQQELALAREQQTEAEDSLRIARAQVESCIAPETLANVQQQLQAERVEAKRLLERYEDLKVQVSRSAAANGGQANPDDVVAAQCKAELFQAREQLSALLEQARIAACKEVESEKVLNALRSELSNERLASEAAAAHAKVQIAKLDGERSRLVAELSESMNTGVAGTGGLHGSGSRQRGSLGALGSGPGAASPLPSGPLDLEAGGGALFSLEDDDGQRKNHDPIPAVVNMIWRAAARYPVVLQYIGETPPRLGPLGRWLVGYIVVLHVFLLLGLV
jgi:hypothetical protein